MDMRQRISNATRNPLSGACIYKVKSLGLLVAEKQVANIFVADLHSTVLNAARKNGEGKVVAGLFQNSLIIAFGPEEAKHWKILSAGQLEVVCAFMDEAFHIMQPEKVDAEALFETYMKTADGGEYMANWCIWIGGARFLFYSQVPEIFGTSIDFGELSPDVQQVTLDFLSFWGRGAETMLRGN